MNLRAFSNNWNATTNSALLTLIMKRRFTTRPAPAVSAVTAVLGVFMLIFGIAVFSQVRDLPGPAMIFVVVWLAAGIGIVIYHIANATRPKGVPTEIIEGEDDASEGKSAAERLQELEDLRSRKLISDAEYEAKRQEILRGI